MSACCSSSNTIGAPSCGTASTTAAVNASNGRGPGVHVTIVHVSLPGSAPLRSAVTNPAKVNDDLPDPDGPTTARNCVVFNFSTRRWMSPSRPKNQAWSASRNGSKPR